MPKLSWDTSVELQNCMLWQWNLIYSNTSDKCTCRSCIDRPDSWSAGCFSSRILSRSFILSCFSFSSIVIAFFNILVWTNIKCFLWLKDVKTSAKLGIIHTNHTFKNNLRDAEIFGFGFCNRMKNIRFSTFFIYMTFLVCF